MYVSLYKFAKIFSNFYSVMAQKSKKSHNSSQNIGAIKNTITYFLCSDYLSICYDEILFDFVCLINLEQSCYLSVIVYINSECRRFLWQSWHCHNSTGKNYNKSCSSVYECITYVNVESFRTS